MARKYDPNRNPWDPPIRDYKQTNWPTYPSRKPRKASLASILGRAVSRRRSGG